ncbi:MAG: hypothetical protein L6R39_001751 [Caloplaca ligustica]|nr:MAG: hypothetical protein L6R39_001751 [Caloplaca ligustica]
MEANQQLGEAGAEELTSSSKPSNPSVTPSTQAKDQVTAPSSAESTTAKATKPLVGNGGAAILTGSLNELTLSGHFSDGTSSQKGMMSPPAPPPKEQDKPTEAPKAEVCSNCFAPATNRCKRCGSSCYCSAGCQKADWIYHKHLCGQFNQYKDRPDAHCVRAILFPVDEKSPRFVWLKANDTVLDLDNISEKLQVTDLLGVDVKEKVAQQQVTMENCVRRGSRSGTREVNSQPHLLLRDESLVDGSKPNMSIGTVTKGNFHFSWRGPVVAVLTSSDETAQSDTSMAFDDMAITDYRDLIDFFAWYGQYVEGEDDFGPDSFWWLSPALKEELFLQRQFQVIRICCDLELEDTKVKYHPFHIGEGHPAMAFLQPAPLTVLVGFPLVLRRFPTHNHWAGQAEATGNENSGPNLLLWCIDPKSKDWGRLPKSTNQGTVVAMRQDKKDLHPHHLESLLVYLSNVFGPAINDTLGSESERQKSEILEMLHPSRVDWFFRYYQTEKVKKDDVRWKDTPPMFEIGAVSKEKEGGT